MSRDRSEIAKSVKLVSFVQQDYEGDAVGARDVLGLVGSGRNRAIRACGDARMKTLFLEFALRRPAVDFAEDGPREISDVPKARIAADEPGRLALLLVLRK